MIETKFNNTTIRNDSEAMIRDVEKLSVEVDIRPSIEPNLIRLGYPYKFNDSRSFEVTVAPGCMLNGYYSDANICLFTRIQHDQFIAECKSIHVPLGDWGLFMPQVELLINGMQRLKQKYDEFAKDKMQALILSSLVEPYMKEVGLDTATLEVSTQGDFVLKMPIVNNAYLQTILTFDNYKKCCDAYVSLAKSLQVFTKPVIRQGIQLDYRFIRDKIKSNNSGSWQVDGVKMTYLDELSEYGDFSQYKKRIGAPVYKCLSDLGYIFYVKNDNLHIVLNKNISLIRSLSTKYTYYQYKNKSGQKMKVKDKSLVLLLRMTAAASLKTGYDFDVKSFCKYYNDDIPFYDNLYFYLERILPYNAEWKNVKTASYWWGAYKNGKWEQYHMPGGICFVLLAHNCYIKIHSKAGDTIDVIWEVLENWGEILKSWDELLKMKDILRDYSDLRLYLEDENKDFELQPKND